MQRFQRLVSSVVWPMSLGSFLVLAERGAAQWQLNQGNLYTTTNAVGIGTPFPQGLLHVQGGQLFVWNSAPASIHAVNSLKTGQGYAVHGVSESEDGAALFGESKASNYGNGVLGAAYGFASVGVHGRYLGKTLGFGVYGSNDNAGVGVSGLSFSSVGTGVVGYADHDDSQGVLGVGHGDKGVGVEGVGNYEGVLGIAEQSTSFAGVHGKARLGPSYGVFSSGDFGATGAKSFVQPHPTDPSVNIRFVCLEGNEAGTYFRGTTRFHNGHAEIPIPEDWQLVSEATQITVQVTPIRSFAQLTIWEKSRERIVVKSDQDCEFDYVVNGVRRGFANIQLRTDNRAYRPKVRNVPYGAELPDEVRQILVQNGTLNTDYTPNEVTAARLGWRLRSPDEVAAKDHAWRIGAERGRRDKANRR